MVTVKLFGLLRLDSGVQQFESKAETVKELYSELIQLAAENGKIITEKNIKSSAVLVNGQQIGRNKKLKDGDQVIFMSVVAGG